MWLFSEIGFFSAVENTADPDTVLVRARFQEDMENLREFASGLNIELPKARHTPGHDYRYRLMVDKAAWGQIAGKLAESIDYPNFKSHIHGDAVRDRAYMDCWSAMRSAQELKRIRGR